MFHHLTLLMIFAFLASSASAAFDWTMGNLTLNHAQNAYCDPSTYQTRTYRGVLAGFVPTYTITDEPHDTHGYIGYHTGQQAIYVVFRGSESLQNWIDDLSVELTTYPAPGCSNCNVHQGFYQAEQSCFQNVASQVKSLRAKYPSYQIVVTGHSLGAALSVLVSADLINGGIGNVRMFNFGSPRVFDTNGANYYNSLIKDRNRVTHHKDMVPHSPMHERFTHHSGEWYEPDNTVTLNACTGNEDPNCSYQWHITSISDHLYYLGLSMGQGDSECAAFL